MSERPVLSGVTRRRMAALLGVVPIAAQVPPSPAPANSTPNEKLQKAYADVHEASEKLSKIDVPIGVEPAFSFKV